MFSMTTGFFSSFFTIAVRAWFECRMHNRVQDTLSLNLLSVVFAPFSYKNEENVMIKISLMIRYDKRYDDKYGLVFC